MKYEKEIERMKDSFVDKLIMYRINHDMSQQEMADMLGISQCAYCNYEVRKRKPSLEVMLCFCIETDESMDYMLSDRDRELKEYVANLPRDKRKAIDELKREIIRGEQNGRC